jgi:hypothetical protein
VPTLLLTPHSTGIHLEVWLYSNASFFSLGVSALGHPCPLAVFTAPLDSVDSVEVLWTLGEGEGLSLS